MAEVHLSEFLGELAKRKFDWAQSNCFLICADWVLLVTGRDPASPWRGRYKTKHEAFRLIREQGGPVALATKAMERVKFILTEVPSAGDVALVWTPVGKRNNKIMERPTGAICVGPNHYAVLTVDLGLVIAPLRLIKAWRVGGC